MVHTTPLDRTWPALPASVPQARHAVREHLHAADTKDPPASDVAVVVSEAVTNAVVHAYRETGGGEFRVLVEVGEEEIALTVDDNGAGMAPRTDSPGLGLGLPLIAQMSERFEIRRRAEGGTRLCVWFNADPAAATLPH